MKICYLILAHDKPRHFYSLLHAIATNNAKVFVHIDLKSNLAHFQHKVMADNIIFIKRRVKVYWAGFSGIQATLNLLAEALQDDINYDYYCLLSGSDYLLKSPAYIENYLKIHQGKEFINLTRMPNEALDKPLSRISTYHVEYVHHRLPNMVADSMAYIVNRLRIQRNYQSILSNVHPYAGSQWWVLSYAAINYIMQFVADNPKFVRFFKNTKIPDESFIHTILGNSEFSNRITRHLTYTDWPNRLVILRLSMINTCKISSKKAAFLLMMLMGKENCYLPENSLMTQPPY